jgi:hypothetical protein
MVQVAIACAIRHAGCAKIGRMSRRNEIIQRAQAEFQAAIDRFRLLREEILRQQRDVLITNSPTARTALDKFEAAIADAFDTFQQSQGEANQAVIDAEVAASATRFDAEQAADQAWREANDAAALKRTKAIRDAEDKFNLAFNAAQHISGPGQERAITSARKTRDEEIGKAERQFTDDTDAAWRAFQRQQSDAREEEISAFEAARAKQGAAVEKAAAVQDLARSKADKALDKALSGDPIAASIREAFQTRLADAEAAAEREKQDILDRMAADLAAATP